MRVTINEEGTELEDQLVRDFIDICGYTESDAIKAAVAVRREEEIKI